MNKIFLWLSGLIFFSSIFSYFFMDWNVHYSRGFLLDKDGQEISSFQAFICLFGGKSILPVVSLVTGLNFFFSFLISGKDSDDQSGRIENSKPNVFPDAFECPECSFKIILNKDEKSIFEVKCKDCGAIIKPYELQKTKK